MIKKVQDEFYQLENKQAKGSKPRGILRCELEGEKCPITFFKVLERQNLQNQTISELYTNGKKSKYSSNPRGIFKFAKKY